MCSPIARAWKSNSSTASGSPFCARPRSASAFSLACLRRRARADGRDRRAAVPPAGRAGRPASCRARRNPRSGRSRTDTASRPAGAAPPACARSPFPPACRPAAAGRARRCTPCPRPEPGASISTPPVPVAAHALRLADAAERAVVADDQRHRAPGLLGQRPAVVAVEVPALEAGGHVGRMTEHAVAQVRPGNREADAAHLLPAELVLRQVFADRLDPARDDRLAPLLRVGRPLLQLRRDRGAVGPHAAHLRHGGAAVGADEDLLAFVHRRSLPKSVYDWRRLEWEILT